MSMETLLCTVSTSSLISPNCCFRGRAASPGSLRGTPRRFMAAKSSWIWRGWCAIKMSIARGASGRPPVPAATIP
eukprot:8215047-Pyramimonas_sp.AAC.1